MATQLDICNLALFAIGQRPITSYNEESTSGRAIRTVYETCLKGTLRAIDWNFARRIEELNLIANEAAPGWFYLYAQPNDCLIIRKVFHEEILEDSIAIEYEVLNSPESHVPAVATNISPARAKYTYYCVDTNVYDSNFIEAFSHKLAAMIAFSLTGDAKIAAGMNQMYNLFIDQAKLVNGNENRTQVKRTSSYISAR